MSAIAEKVPARNKGGENSSRLAILRAGGEEFALKGFAGARTETIAALAGVKHTLVFYHFKTKEQLYSSVLEIMFSEWNVRVGPALAIEASPKERLLAYIDSYFDFIAEFPLSPKLVQQEQMRQSSTSADQLHRMVERYVRPIHRKLVALLKEGVALREFYDVDIEHCVHSISALITFYFTGGLTVESLEGAQVRPRRIELRRKAVVEFVSRAVFR
jgi:AcrR family transcriptional regulator